MSFAIRYRGLSLPVTQPSSPPKSPVTQPPSKEVPSSAPNLPITRPTAPEKTIPEGDPDVHHTFC